MISLEYKMKGLILMKQIYKRVPDKTEQLNVRVSPSILHQLDLFCEHFSMTRAEYLRSAIINYNNQMGMTLTLIEMRNKIKELDINKVDEKGINDINQSIELMSRVLGLEKE